MTVSSYNGLDDETVSCQGQAFTAGSDSTTFATLALTASPTYEIYVHLAAAPTGDWQGDYSASDGSGA